MSFLAGRLAGKEGAYFLQESKQAVARILEKQKNSANNVIKPIAENSETSSSADVLPEVLRHSLPSKIFSSSSDSSGSSLSTASKWAIKPDPKRGGGPVVSADALNPLRGYVSLPQVTFGPKRWQLPNSEGAVIASTANDLRQDKHATINPEKLKAAAAGLSQSKFWKFIQHKGLSASRGESARFVFQLVVGGCSTTSKRLEFVEHFFPVVSSILNSLMSLLSWLAVGSAFAIATAIVFGGATLIFGLAASRLEMHNSDDIRSKGRDLIQPRLEMFREQLAPLKTRAEAVSMKWHLEKEGTLKERPLIKELSRTLGAKS